MTSSRLSGKKWFALLLALSFAISFAIVNFTGSEGLRKKFIDGDGSGIYAYLPTLLLYQTIDFTPVFELEKSRRPSSFGGHYFHKSDDVHINKFTSGTALLQLPFFLLAWLASVIFGLPADGYNIFFQYAVAIAAVFWALTGIMFFVRLAGTYGVGRTVAWFTAAAGFFGTNLFYYTFGAPAASHVYSFAVIAAFLYFGRKTFVYNKRSTICMAAFTLGLVVLVRPVNILVMAALPFLAGSAGRFGQTVRLKLKRKDYLLTISLFLLAIAPQLIINYFQTGQLLVYGYRDEGFDFTDPAIGQFLFSYQKGWFVYTPLMLLLFPAAIYLWKRSFYEMISFVAFFVLLVYVFSSWWNWIYGDSFGMRPMVDYYALFFLILALFAVQLRTVFLRSLVMVFAVLAILLNLFQAYQYTKGIIHPDSMNRQAYWHVFLKGGKQYHGVVAAGDEYYYGELSPDPFFSTEIDFNETVEGWTYPGKLYFIPDAGHTSIRLDENTVYSSSYSYKVPENLRGKKNIYLRFETEFLEPRPNSAAGALFVVDITDNTGKTVFYKAFKVKRLPDDIANQWRKGSIGLKLPLITTDMETIKCYIWNKEKQEFYIQLLGLKLYFYHP